MQTVTTAGVSEWPREPEKPAERHGMHLVAVVVLVLGLAVTGGLTAASLHNYLRVEQHLTTLQAKLTAAALTAAPADLERRLQYAAAVSADGDGAAGFAQALRSSTTKTGPFASAVLVRMTPEGPRRVTSLGAKPLLAPGSARARTLFEDAAAHPGQLEVIRLVGPDGAQRLGYALAATRQAGTFVAYASQIVAHHVTIPPSNVDANLRFVIYFGTRPVPAAAVETNADRLPLGGTTATVPVPFGNQTLTLVISPRNSLAGGLSAAMAWIIAAFGALASVLAGVAAERLIRRRERSDERAASSDALYRRQRQIAETLQRSLLPIRLPDRAELEIAVRYLPGTDGIEVGGDWYDVVDVDELTIFFTVGDVVGRGLDAATVMAGLRHRIDAYAIAGAEPEEALDRAGAGLDVAADGRFATVVCGRLDLPSGLLSVANAGHPPPVVIHPDRCELLPTVPGPPLGVGHDYTPVPLQLQPGSVILAYTDGLIERRGESLTEGLTRLCSAANLQLPLEQLLDQVLAALVPDGPPDDIALLGLRWHP